MKLKLGNGIALSTVAMLFLSMMAIFPASSVATPKIYMDPAVNEVGKDHLEGAGIGFKWNITLWVTGYGTPPVFAWQVGLLYDLVAGINCTRAWVANFDPAYIFVDAGPGVTYPTTEVVTPSPQDILIWNTTVVDLENPVSDAWRWTDGTNKYNVHDYVPNCSGKFGPCAFLRLGNETSGDTTWCHIESVAGNLQVVVKQAGFAKVADTLTTQPAQGPPPDPAKLAIFEFEIIYAPPSGKVFSNLDIDNLDTYLLNYDLDEVPTAKVKGYYEYKYAVVNLEVKPNQHIADKLETFDVEVWLNNVTESDRVIGAQFRLQYNDTLLEVQKVTEGTFFERFGNTFSVNYTILSENDDPENYIKYGPHIYVCIAMLASDGQYTNFPNGSEILAAVTFRGRYRSFYGALNSSLTLTDVKVVDDAKNPPYGEPNVIPTIEPRNGYYEISPIQVLPMLKVQPEVYEAKKKDESFQINVTVYDLDVDAQLKSVEFKLTYNATVLEVLNTTEGSFLPGFGNTSFNYSVGSDSVTIRNHIETLFAGFPNGNGTIATIAFKAIRQGSYPEETNSTLNLTEIVLLDIYQNMIPTSDSINGFYKISPSRPVDILLYAAIITVLAAIVIAAAIVTYYKRTRKHKSRTV